MNKKSSKIVSNYPKYLSKFTLLRLQFKDYMFRETFVYQVIVFLDCLRRPIKDQIDTFSVDEPLSILMDALLLRA